MMKKIVLVGILVVITCTILIAYIQLSSVMTTKYNSEVLEQICTQSHGTLSQEYSSVDLDSLSKKVYSFTSDYMDERIAEIKFQNINDSILIIVSGFDNIISEENDAVPINEIGLLDFIFYRNRDFLICKYSVNELRSKPLNRRSDLEEFQNFHKNSETTQ